MMLAKLYECRKSMKLLFGDKYAEKVAEYKDYILAVMAKKNLSYLESAIEVAKLWSAKLADPGIAIALTMAAAVEISEEKNPT